MTEFDQELVALGMARVRSRSGGGGVMVCAAFGQQLREVRRARGMSQEDLARRVGLHATVIGRFERGAREPRLKSILRLARGLGVKPGELVEGLDTTEDEA